MPTASTGSGPDTVAPRNHQGNRCNPSLYMHILFYFWYARRSKHAWQAGAVRKVVWPGTPRQFIMGDVVFRSRASTHREKVSHENSTGTCREVA